jgi:hypothetical protein
VFFAIVLSSVLGYAAEVTIREFLTRRSGRKGKMKINTLCSVWPPFTTLKRDRGFFRSELDDIVLSAELGRDAVSKFIGITIRTVAGAEHRAVLRLPEHLLDKALPVITKKIGSTLETIGEIDIS